MFSPPPDEVEALKLKCLPVDHNLFRLIADKFRFHRALAEILENGSAAFSRIPCEIEKRQCNGRFDTTGSRVSLTWCFLINS